MTTPASKLAFSSSVLLLALAVAAQDGGDKKPEATHLMVPAGKAPVVDGKIEGDEWKPALVVPFLRGDEERGSLRILRAGRTLHLAGVLPENPATSGVRFNFRDPATRVTHVVAVVPSSSPRSPLEAWRSFPGREARQFSTATADLRFGYTEKGWNFELALPLELIEFARGDTEYHLSVEIWHLPTNRPIAVYPGQRSLRPGENYQPVRPVGDWGASVKTPENPPRNGALSVLEEIAVETSRRPISGVARRPVLHAYLGWRAGRYKREPLAKLEKSLSELAVKYPGYAALAANLALVRAGMSDFAGAVSALDAVEMVAPALAAQERRVMIRVEMLRNAGRFGDAVALIDKWPELLDKIGEARAARTALVRMRRDWELETRMRKADAERDDLPRVRVETTKGNFVIELFEDDAPNSVASIVRLAEDGFYDGTKVHWASGGRRMMAGDPNSRDADEENDGFGDPGYLLEPEPSRRLNWRYTVALADKRDQRRSSGCAMMIHLAHAPLFDGFMTTVGRVVEGHDVLAKLQYGDEWKTVRVVRKRDHKYEVRKRKP